MKASLRLGGAAVLYVSLFLHSLMLAMALVVPITPETNVEPRTDTLLPYSEPVPALSPGSGNAVVLPASSQTIMQKKLDELRKMMKGVSKDTTYQDKHAVRDFLRTLATGLTTANQRGEPYPRDALYNDLKHFVTIVQDIWRPSEIRSQVTGPLMECMGQTQPLGKFAELPRELELNEISGRMAKDLSMNDNTFWRALEPFVKKFRWVLEQANEQKLTYNRLALDEALTDLRSAVEKRGKYDLERRNAALEVIDNFLVLIWTAPRHTVTYTVVDSHSMPGLGPRGSNLFLASKTPPPPYQLPRPYPCPSLPINERLYAERRMTGLVAHPKNHENIFFLPQVVEAVPDDLCSQKFKEWTFALALMKSEVEESGAANIKSASDQIDLCQKKLRWKADWYDAHGSSHTVHPYQLEYVA